MAALLGLGLPAVGHAQDPSPTPTPPDPLAGVPVQVLNQQQVTYGNHTITLNRIAPPTFPSPTPTPAPQTGANTNAAHHGPQTRSARGNDPGGNADKTLQIVFLSATVYDHQFTALRWCGGVNPEFSAYVNLDFNCFAGVEQIETADTVYLIFLGLGDDTAASLPRQARRRPTSRLSRQATPLTRSSRVTPPRTRTR